MKGLAKKTVLFAWIREECKKAKQIEIPVSENYRGPSAYLDGATLASSMTHFSRGGIGRRSLR